MIVACAILGTTDTCEPGATTAQLSSLADIPPDSLEVMSRLKQADESNASLPAGIMRPHCAVRGPPLPPVRNFCRGKLNSSPKFLQGTPEFIPFLQGVPKSAPWDGCRSCCPAPICCTPLLIPRSLSEPRCACLFAFKIKLKCRRHLSQAVFSEEALQASCLVAKCRSGRLVGGKLLAFDSALAARFQCH